MIKVYDVNNLKLDMMETWILFSTKTNVFPWSVTKLVFDFYSFSKEIISQKNFKNVALLSLVLKICQIDNVSLY